ncbi:hypothetical protein [Mycetocola saprophilus]|uniref:hypothetical protein n=1 Tax=Mycetocola saprophilus TaxID=76636 RepID=UPI003BF21706
MTFKTRGCHAYVAPAVLVIGFFTGCSATAPEITTGRAVLETETGLVALPLDQYQTNGPEYDALKSRAQYAVTNSCLRAEDAPEFVHPTNWAPEPRPIAWDPFIWSPQLAAQFGFTAPPGNDGAEQTDTDPRSKAREIVVRCETTGFDAVSAMTSSLGSEDIFYTYVSDSLAATKSDPRAQEILKRVASCLSGLNPSRALHTTSELDLPLAQQIPLASAEAKCVAEEDSAQKFFDLVASYQDKAILEHKTALENNLNRQRDVEKQLIALITEQETK